MSMSPNKHCEHADICKDADHGGGNGQRGIPAEAVCFFEDGDSWCCVHGDFIGLQESPVGFGDTFENALASLERDKEQQGGEE